MSIILADERNGAASPAELTFEKASIIAGRDTTGCDIVFSRERFPMVSRRHLELRWQSGGWWAIDLNSSYGVYVNDVRINAPQRLTFGDAVRLGESGPVVRVIWYDNETASAPEPANVPVPPPPPQKPISTPPVSVPPAAQRPSTPPLPTPPAPQVPPVRSQSSPPPSSAAVIEFVSGPQRPPFPIGPQSVWIGREADCTIVIDGEAGMVSRKHASIRTENGSLILEDNKSFNGTLVNEQRITSATPLYHNDEIRLGVGGPVLRLNAPQHVAPAGADVAGQRGLTAGQLRGIGDSAGPKTMVFRLDGGTPRSASNNDAQPQLLMSLTFGDKRELSIGRGDDVDISLDGLQISKRHARLVRAADGVAIEDLNSTNGVHIAGKRVSKQLLEPGVPAQIGSFLIEADTAGGISVFDTRSKTRLDAVGLTVTVKARSGGGTIKLLDSISLSIKPNEFVGVLGPSGAGKSTLTDAMNGMRPAASGNVLINGLDLYRNLNSLKQYIGYVPQDDVIHRELTVYKTLYYIAKLRLSRDVSSKEIKQILDEVLDVTGLAERRNVPVSQLSGGQRKRVSIAVELITKPSVLFLDEPTSGLDPATEEKIMRLFRQIAESGRTVILTTHAMENVRLFDKIVILVAGKLAFYGPPAEALTFFAVKDFTELYSKLESSSEQSAAASPAETRRIAEERAESLKQRFLAAPQYDELIGRPLSEIGNLPPATRQKKRRLGIFGSISQWSTLSRRYFRVLLRDKLTLFILLAQAPAIALMTFLVVDNARPRDFVYFTVALVAVWFGTSVAAREIVREQTIFRRERMVNLGLIPYIGSKFFILGLIVLLQCLFLFVPLKIADLAGLMSMPGELFGLPQLWTMLLTASVGVALGLFISAVVRTSEMATSLVPLILIPQILFSGIVGVPTGVSKPLTLTMPAAWSFDTMKRFSTLDTLEPEGADPAGKTKGLGLYKYVETENDRIAEEVKQQLDDYKAGRELRADDAAAGTERTPQTTTTPSLKAIPKDLSGYVTFLHPWMNEVLNQAVLMLMFGILALLTLIVMRLKDK